jgi:hypothetical protein
MVKDMPKLAEYEKLWPARQQLKMHLKYTSEQARRVDYKDTAHKLERV